MNQESGEAFCRSTAAEAGVEGRSARHGGSDVGLFGGLLGGSAGSVADSIGVVFDIDAEVIFDALLVLGDDDRTDVSASRDISAL